MRPFGSRIGVAALGAVASMSPALAFDPTNVTPLTSDLVASEEGYPNPDEFLPGPPHYYFAMAPLVTSRSVAIDHRPQRRAHLE
jgi:hypothetical protein